MAHAIDIVFIDAILVPLLRELGLPETLPLVKLSPRMQKWVLGEAACLQRDAMSHPTFAVLVEYGYPLTRESYLTSTMSTTTSTPNRKVTCLICFRSR
jgi:hypothetical protein